MVNFRYYDKEKRMDYAWYESTSVIFSICEDKENELKELTVVFKGGKAYVYHAVDVSDYVMFLHGGLDGSNGKALNAFIKPKYEFEKIDDYDLSAIAALLEQYKERKKKEMKEKAEEKTSEE